MVNNGLKEASKEAAQQEAEKRQAEQAQISRAMPSYTVKARNDEYPAAFESWKQQILASTAVTYIEASGRLSVFVQLTPDKYESVAGAQNIAKQLAISYCKATGVQRAHFYVMLGSHQFADAWSQ